MIAFEKPTLDDLNYISMKLRERDFIELAATSFEVQETILRALSVEGYKTVVKVNGEPVFIGGFIPSAPNTVHAWGFGTDKAGGFMKSITRHAKTCIAALKTTGVTRIETRCDLKLAPIAWLCAIGLNQTVNIGKYNGRSFALQYGEF